MAGVATKIAYEPLAGHLGDLNNGTPGQIKAWAAGAAAGLGVLGALKARDFIKRKHGQEVIDNLVDPIGAGSMACAIITIGSATMAHLLGTWDGWADVFGSLCAGGCVGSGLALRLMARPLFREAEIDQVHDVPFGPFMLGPGADKSCLGTICLVAGGLAVAAGLFGGALVLVSNGFFNFNPS